MDITKGEYVIKDVSNPLYNKIIKTNKYFIACIFSDGFQEPSKIEADANADLICEAFNVANETGFSPRQLAERNKKLLEAMESIIEDPETASWIIETGKAAIKQSN